MVSPTGKKSIPPRKPWTSTRWWKHGYAANSTYAYQLKYISAIPIAVYAYTSDPTEKDTDGDGFLDGGGLNKYGLTQKDPEPRTYNKFIHFGTDAYFEELKEYKASVLEGLRFVPFNSMIRLSNDKMTKHMMEQVNTTDFHSFIPDDNWNLFCTEFNGYVDTVTMDIHYFRNKLNRAPATLDELLEEKDKWELLEPGDSVYHMFGQDGEYNLKFVSTDDGKYEAVYNKAEQLLTYVEPGEKYYDKDGNARTVVNDPINMGTYNYADPKKDKANHILMDVVPYSDEFRGHGWYNVAGYPVECSERGENKKRFKANFDDIQKWWDDQTGGQIIVR